MKNMPWFNLKYMFQHHFAISFQNEGKERKRVFFQSKLISSKDLSPLKSQWLENLMENSFVRYDHCCCFQIKGDCFPDPVGMIGVPKTVSVAPFHYYTATNSKHAHS